jgi:hypothetical protein
MRMSERMIKNRLLGELFKNFKRCLILIVGLHDLFTEVSKSFKGY